ncbi:MAG: hypothetical protein IH944_05925 [Armatimonadetes bacterium]|nr:hypothetical protein [Armatimonadota bacterium]
MPENPPFELESFWWVYFVRGAAREAYSDEQHELMLSEHVGNLERIWKEGKSVVGGPFTGDGARRGIVVMKGDAFKDTAGVRREFADDPLVKSRLLKVQVFKWWTKKGALHEVKADAKRKQYVFVIYNRPDDRPEFDDDFTEKTQAAHLAYIGEMQEKHKLLIAGPFEDAGAMRGILIFDRTDLDEVKKIVGADPWVVAGGLAAEYLTLSAAQGAFGD